MREGGDEKETEGEDVWWKRDGGKVRGSGEIKLTLQPFNIK